MPSSIPSRLLALCALLPLSSAAASERVRTQICIYGATPAGIAAAVAAGRTGKEVLLVEATASIGGLKTSGLSYTDFHTFESLTGTFLEFSQRVEAHYRETYGPDSQQVEDSFRGTFGEPKVNLEVFERMLAEIPSITILKETRLVEASVEGGRLSFARFASPGEAALEVQAAVFVDASYEGDLMAAAGVDYRVGRDGQELYGESLAPGTSDEFLQGYNFRFCATDDPENRVPFSPPPGYRREDFLDALPILQSGEIDAVFGYPNRCVVKAHLPAMPNRKYDVNDVSRGLIRLSLPGRNLEWPEGDAETRQRIFDEHLYYNLGLIYFASTDEAVPAPLREGAANWGWCRDEFLETGHLPPQLYVREARRMVGRHIYVQQDSEHAPGDARAKHFADSIAVGGYSNNCHGTYHEGPLLAGRHGGEFYNPVPPYQIPYGVLLPESPNNLLVPVAVSASHVGFCALRLEPIWMSLGQAAGHAAVLALETDATLPDLELARLHDRLHADGAATIYVSDVLPDNQDFAAVQWWGTAGGLHGLEPMPERPGQRGERIFGQYFEANPGHEAKLDAPLDPETRTRWEALASTLGLVPPPASETPTRGVFIRAAYAARPL